MVFTTWLSSRAVYFLQTGGGALSNTVSAVHLAVILIWQFGKFGFDRQT